jgi:RNA polymerase sigma-70 factor (ECF subfamily)
MRSFVQVLAAVATADFLKCGRTIMGSAARMRSAVWTLGAGLAVGTLLVNSIAQAADAIDPERKSPDPVIVSTVPEVGAVDVDPALAEIKVTFDRDMGKGMSWTGAAPLFPPIDKSRKAEWTDARTCILPVKLEKGTYYRVGINSSSRRNFRAADGKPAPSSVLYFVTLEASEDVKSRVKAPTIVSFEPAADASDVDPATSELRVTFNVPMDAGMSWTGGGPNFPKLGQGKRAAWSEDQLTCTLPVSLEPNQSYELGLNNLTHNNFQSVWGVPLESTVYKFQTRAAAE